MALLGGKFRGDGGVPGAADGLRDGRHLANLAPEVDDVVGKTLTVDLVAGQDLRREQLT